MLMFGCSFEIGSRAPARLQRTGHPACRPQQCVPEILASPSPETRKLHPLPAENSERHRDASTRAQHPRSNQAPAPCSQPIPQEKQPPIGKNSEFCSEPRAHSARFARIQKFPPAFTWEFLRIASSTERFIAIFSCKTRDFCHPTAENLAERKTGAVPQRTTPVCNPQDNGKLPHAPSIQRIRAANRYTKATGSAAITMRKRSRKPPISTPASAAAPM